MPHISKRSLSEQHLKSLMVELVRSLERSFKQGKTKSVFYEFFTYTERIMFSKRLAVIAMLSRDVSSPAIAEVLHMSPATVDRMSAKYERGKYDGIIKHALGKKDIWEIIGSILTVGGLMPPRAGGQRWRRFNKSMYDDELLKS
jgi:Trp operon repressor